MYAATDLLVERLFTAPTPPVLARAKLVSSSPAPNVGHCVRFAGCKRLAWQPRERHGRAPPAFRVGVLPLDSTIWDFRIAAMGESRPNAFGVLHDLLSPRRLQAGASGPRAVPAAQQFADTPAHRDAAEALPLAAGAAGRV